MLDSGFMPPLHMCSSDRNVTGGGCVVATGEDYCLHYVLYLMHLSVAHKQSLCCGNLIPARFAGELSQGGLLDMDACQMAVHML